MAESPLYIRTDDRTDLFVRARQGEFDAPAVLFIHGLGDCSLAFAPFFAESSLERFTLLAPDLPGYGRTRVENGAGGGLDGHVAHLKALLAETVAGKLVVVGHSMGGLVATLLLRALEREDAPPRTDPLHDPLVPAGYVCVEGNLTAADAFISRRAVNADEKSRFDRWYDRFFAGSTTGAWAEQNPQLAHYGESLRLCDPAAFLRDCRDLVAWKDRTDPDTGISAAGSEYLRLCVPALYVYGSLSVARETRAFLAEHDLPRAEIPGAGHWTMLDARARFASLLADRVKEWTQAGGCDTTA
ncbi:MAG: hypothetical protein MAG453_00371 [Calditrichaeota bacterium]|nr:hypothetical protein [Calditrichota bacterium]